VSEINGTDRKKLYDVLLEQAKQRTAAADLELDDEGKAKKRDVIDELKADDGVLMVESRATHLIAPSVDETPVEESLAKKPTPRTGQLFDE
jgi:hypothetical protein